MFRWVFVISMLLAWVNARADADTNLIKNHLTVLTKTNGFRNHENLERLNHSANYIHEVFSEYSDRVRYQEYLVGGEVYRNVICSFGPETGRRIIVGAHYDVAGEQEGADDNASGVVGLLELARMLNGNNPAMRIDLVAYTLEEPPYFRTEFMGSHVHAQSLGQDSVDVVGMVCLEMIGYFSDDKRSQDYPLDILSLIYGRKGNYITVVNKFGKGKFARQYTRRFKRTKTIRTKKFTGPPSLPGIDFSDHLNYWKFGYSALMITDTAFYRNKNYHEPTDTMEILDIVRMSKVIDGVFMALMAF